jgi:hypothetical protein
MMPSHHLRHHLDWALVIKTLARPNIQLIRNGIQLLLAMPGQVGTLGQVLPNQAVDVFVAADPGGLRPVAKQHQRRHAQPYCNRTPTQRNRRSPLPIPAIVPQLPRWDEQAAPAQFGVMEGLQVRCIGVQPASKINALAGGDLRALQPHIPLAGNAGHCITVRAGRLQGLVHVPFDAQQGQVEAPGDAGEVQLVQAIEQEHLLNAAWQALEPVQQGILGVVAGSGRWVLKRQQQAAHGQLLAQE